MEAAKRTLDKKEPVLVVAECGSGKSKIGAGAVYASQLSKGKPKTFNVVLCPSHMTEKWVRELSETIPNSAAMVVRSINDLKRFYRMYQREKKTYYAVISKEQARDGYMHRPAATYDQVQTKFVCPDCRTPIMQSITKDDVSYRIFAEPEYFCRETAENHKCEACGAVLWEALEPASQSEWVKAGDYGFVHRKFAYRALEHVKKENACRIVSELVAHPTARFGKGTEFPAAGAVRRFPLSTYIKKS